MRATVGWRVCSHLLSRSRPAVTLKGNGEQGRIPSGIAVFFRFLGLGMVMLCACAAWPSAASAADSRVDELARKLKEIQRQLDALKAARMVDHGAALKALQQSTVQQFTDLHKRIDDQPKVSMPNARLTVVSADGDFSLALRATVQFDVGYFAQGRNPPSVDLNSGTNFRRAQFGLAGTLFHDWSY